MDEKRPKIGIDLTYIKDDKVSGIKKHGEEIVDGLSNIDNKYEITLFINKNLKEVYEKKFPKYKKIIIKSLPINSKYINAIYNRVVGKKYNEYIIRNAKCDLVFYPYSTLYTPINKEINSIQEILDVIPLDVIENKNSICYKILQKRYKKLMNKSNYIVTMSEYSKKRLLDIDKNYAGEIEVIPSSIGNIEKTNKNVFDIINTKSKYILCINAFQKHKNQITLVKAFNKIKDKIPEYNLVLVGAKNIRFTSKYYNKVKKYVDIERLNDRVIFLSNISDENRNTLLYNADLFITTSLQEGFGRTPVEAGMCEIPVISTKETSLPEVTLNMVEYYENPTDDKELANKIIQVLENRPTKERLTKIANKFKEEYDIQKVVKKHINVIEKCVKNMESMK